MKFEVTLLFQKDKPNPDGGISMDSATQTIEADDIAGACGMFQNYNNYPVHPFATCVAINIITVD